MPKEIDQIEVRGGRVHNLKNIDIDIPLNQFVAISGPSGSGKSSLAMGILYAEGSRRYLEALSSYTRRRIGQSSRAEVQEVKHIPSAVALRQRPGVPSERSTVGSMSEIFNVVRLAFSRLGSPVCPNGHRVKASLQIAQAFDRPASADDGESWGIHCPTCGVFFQVPTAADFAFNGDGACEECHGTGEIRTIDPTTIIKDENLSIDEGAVASWRLPGRAFMATIARSRGVRTDVPYKDLSAKEKDFVLHGEKKRYRVDLNTSTGRVYHNDNSLYENAYDAIYDSLKTVTSERSVKRLNRFFTFSTCPVCHGSRINKKRLEQTVAGQNIAEVADLTLGALTDWRDATCSQLPDNMQKMAAAIFDELTNNLRPLLELGLDYLTLSRAGNTLSTGELQRIQLAKTLRTETTGVLYVLDEPSIGLHPDNVAGLIHVFSELIDQGNSLVVVDHNVDLIGAADWIIEVGPGSGVNGGQILTAGRPAELMDNPASLIGPYLKGTAQIMAKKTAPTDPNAVEQTEFEVRDFFNIKDVKVHLPEHEITAVTGFSGAGKSSLILDSLVPSLSQPDELPKQVKSLRTNLKRVVSVDAKPVGKNTRSSVATYTSIMDNLRHLFAELPEARAKGFDLASFSYNNKAGACPNCGGLGMVSLDVQYLADVEEVCPVCHGNRFKPEISAIKWQGYTIVDLLNLSVKEALPVFSKQAKIERELRLLSEIGLDYLHLGQSTPSLSGGEAQRLKLVKHLNQSQKKTLFVFDEPSIGLHPSDVLTLLDVFNRLKQKGATIVIITHDLDLMTNADYLIDLGPRGGSAGGQLMAEGPVKDLLLEKHSLTLDYLKKHVDKFHLWQ
ncbi:excinuclease ABC subunit UvrA [Fructobacillus sp. M1-13]|uniref:UvrABC system protein A n=1 Tax=Fructobacillus papyriferae TaxID=2713171 RepID=A0ABS5QQ64_9LACO|nr:excinuclease ABC subunit UvrA [Fructobacillus papyriferae]MBS9335328.1 excinuclease ABC subunit UvrA [Fructobacillus papyriferae]MCD2159003.1 excinuclease ABC subunit UvrA [Fructobacillus papyriferae]